MRCPSCQNPLLETVEVCQNCGFTLARLDRKFGTVPRKSRYLTDTAPYFRDVERHSLEKKMVEMERKFSGLSLSVMTMAVNPSFKLKEYVFWLINRCHFSAMVSRLERNFSVVLFFDATSRSILLTTGFGLREACPEDFLQRTIERAVPDFKLENFHRGTLLILRELQKQLKAYCTTGLGEPRKELHAVPQKEQEMMIAGGEAF